MVDYTTDIRIGTSGYSFDDWKENFYPKEIDKGKMLDHYVNYFPTVEINSTYYRIPHPAVTSNIVKKAPDGFDFIVKVPQSFTHKRTEYENDIQSFRDALKPFEDANNLSGLLAQFPYSFKFSQDNLEYLSIVNEIIEPHQIYVEFRHNSWVNRPMYDYLKSNGIGYVCVDEPQISSLLKPDLFATTDTAYIRFHGRNAEKWWNGGDLRYDYDYSVAELEDWRNKLMKIKAKVHTVYAFFNNCHHGQAAKNALEFMHLLGI